jgi:hypothetical protein
MQVGGYRDLMICFVLDAHDDLHIIGEIQVPSRQLCKAVLLTVYFSMKKKAARVSAHD